MNYVKKLEITFWSNDPTIKVSEMRVMDLFAIAQSLVSMSECALTNKEVQHLLIQNGYLSVNIIRDPLNKFQFKAEARPHTAKQLFEPYSQEQKAEFLSYLIKDLGVRALCDERLYKEEHLSQEVQPKILITVDTLGVYLIEKFGVERIQQLINEQEEVAIVCSGYPINQLTQLCARDVWEQQLKPYFSLDFYDFEITEEEIINILLGI